jgi:protein-S-isoprenylcysteine O-methyltransferase Ste14
MVSRVLILLYAIVSYALFTISFLYALGFVGNYVVPKSIDKSMDIGGATGLSEAIVVNLLLMSLFAIQHSVMARTAFKRWSAKFFPCCCSGSGGRSRHRSGRRAD